MKYILLLLFFITTTLVKAQSVSTDAGSQLISSHYYFMPTSFSNKFSLNISPVLKIKSGDTVSTETVDAAGFDKNGSKRQKGGNPLTGPFYVENTTAGDVLAVTLLDVALNRDNAFTTESFSSRSVGKPIADQFKKVKLVKWKLDTLTGYASIINDSLYEHLDSFRVAVKPFLGCIGVAPSVKKNEILSFFQGAYGGNLDYKAVTKSSTIYLPVFHNGAYLFIGDGHALQGDGEIAGNALETSMNVSFMINVIKKDSFSLKYPRIEDSTYIISLGVEKSLDDALKIATSGLLEWLQKDYDLSLQEATQVMSTTIEYDIAEIADPQIVVGAKIKKEFLKNLKTHIPHH